MAFKKGLQYDPGTNRVLGSVTLPPTPDKQATKVLTAIMSFMAMKYKQIVAYELTGPSVIGSVLWENVRELIIACGERNIKIMVVVCVWHFNSIGLFNCPALA